MLLQSSARLRDAASVAGSVLQLVAHQRAGRGRHAWWPEWALGLGPREPCAASTPRVRSQPAGQPGADTVGDQREPSVRLTLGPNGAFEYPPDSQCWGKSV